MKILFLSSNTDLTGGKERYDTLLLKELREKGADARVVILRHAGLGEKIAFVLSACVAFLKQRPDYIWCAHIGFAPVALFLNIVARTPYVVATHGIEVWNIKTKIQKKTLEKARVILSVSEYTKEKILKQIQREPEDIFLLPNAIDGNAFYIQEPKEKKRPTILTVSRLYPGEMTGKGILKVIDALPKVLAEFREAKYAIVGKGMKPFGDARDIIAKHAEARGVRERVILAGRVSDRELLEYYNSADVFILPSTIEGFGVVFLEALACGLPVIAGNKDASQEALLGGKLGILVNPENTKEIAQAIIKVLKKECAPHLCSREYLRKEVLRAYGLQVWKKRFEDLTSRLEHTKV